MSYECAEAAFQAQKCPEQAWRFKLLNNRKSKQLGRRVPLRKYWEVIKDQIMYEVVLAKFQSDEWLLGILLKTEDMYIQEGNWWYDTYWGTDLRTGVGYNKLGHILMKVRDELRGVING